MADKPLSLAGWNINPRDCDVVNVANIRHVWLMELPLSIGWRKDNEERE